MNAPDTTDSRFSGKREPVPIVLTVVIFGICIWLLDLGGFFRPLEGVIYDHLARANVRHSAAPDDILLVEFETARELRSQDSYVRLLRGLEDLGAEEILFMEPPRDTYATFFKEARRHENLFFGKWLDSDTSYSAAIPTASQQASEDGALRFGAVALPPAPDGVARRQYAYMRADENIWPMIEILAAANRLPAGTSLPEGEYNVNFCGGAGSLPRVTSEQLIAGRVIPELVQGRSVLVGGARTAREPGIVTPTTESAQPMSLLEFQGHALNTLLSGKIVTGLSIPGKFILYVLIGLISVFIYQFIRVSWLPLTLALIFCILTAATYLFFIYLHYQLPLAALLAIELLCCGLILYRSALSYRAGLMHSLQEVSSSISKHYAAPNFFTARNYWDFIVDLVTQSLDARRMVFLEVVPSSHQLHRAASLDWDLLCKNSEKYSYSKAPFSTVLEAKRPVAMDKVALEYLNVSDAEGAVYIAPLQYAQMVFGFWLVEQKASAGNSDDHFEQLLQRYSQEISALLYRRRHLYDVTQGTGSFRHAVGFAPGQRESQAMTGLHTRLEQRLRRWETIFGENGTPSITYDCFGHLTEINVPMTALLGQENLAPYDLPAVELIAGLTHVDMAVVRKCWQNIMVEKSLISLPANLQGVSGTYVLNIYPLVFGREGRSLDDATVLDVDGVCCQIVDQTESAQLEKIKEHLAEMLGTRLRNMLAPIELSADMLAEESLSASERRNCHELIHHSLDDGVELIRETEEYFAKQVTLDRRVERLPVEVKGPLALAMQAVSPSTESRDITFDLHQPMLLSYVLASPRELQGVFEDILFTLADDARSETKIDIDIKEEEGAWISFEFTNDGFGFPDEHLQRILRGDEDIGEEKFDKIRHAVQQIEQWSGKTHVQSEVGKGTKIGIKLLKFG